MLQERYVDMRDVIGDTAYEYGIPIISFDNLVVLGKRAVQVYHLEERAKYISFDMVCDYISQYISTPFGKNTLKQLLK